MASGGRGGWTVTAILVAAVWAAAGVLPSEAQARSQSSLGDLGASAAAVPDWYPLDTLPVDTSGWTVYDATNSSRASQLGCSRAIPNDGNDDAPAIHCFMTRVPQRSVVFLPAGTYHCRSANGVNSCFAVSGSERVLRGAGAAQTIITSARTHFIVNSNNYSARGTSVTWTGGYARGSRVLNVSSTTPFAAGGWVELTAAADPEVDGGSGSLNSLSYFARVTCVGGSGSDCTGTGAGQIRIDRPLRHDFDTGSQQATRWTPYVHSGIEDLALRYDDPLAAGKDFSGVTLSDLAECWITGVDFDNALDTMLLTSRTTRMLVEGNEFGLLARREAWQKAALKILSTHDSEFVNNVWSNSHVAFQVNGLSTGNVIAYNRMFRPTAAGYQWCERSFFIHGGAGIELLFEGNDFECGVQWDGLQGPAGHRVVFYRNRGRVAGSNYTAAAGGPTANLDGSLIYAADIPSEPWRTQEGWSAQAVLRDWLFAGNMVENLGHTANLPGWGTNANGQRTRFERNVVRGVCSLENASSVTSACQNRAAGVNSLRAPEQTVWSTNAVDADAAPSAWSTFSFPRSLVYENPPSWWCQESGPFPNIGAPSDNFAAPATLSRLPAEVRFRGSACTRSGAAAPPPPPILLP